MLTKTTTVDRIEYLPEINVIQVREVTRVIENETIIATSYYRYTIDSTTDIGSIADENVLKACNLYFG